MTPPHFFDNMSHEEKHIETADVSQFNPPFCQSSSSTRLPHCRRRPRQVAPRNWGKNGDFTGKDGDVIRFSWCHMVLLPFDRDLYGLRQKEMRAVVVLFSSGEINLPSPNYGGKFISNCWEIQPNPSAMECHGTFTNPRLHQNPSISSCGSLGSPDQRPPVRPLRLKVLRSSREPNLGRFSPCLIYGWYHFGGSSNLKKLRGKKKIHWIMIKDSVGCIILTHPYLNGGERWMLKHVKLSVYQPVSEKG